MSLADIARIEIPGGIRVSVPSSSDCLTTYVLREQGDWFEQEIDFVRRYITTGMRVIDIGANYGLYTATMASNVGGSGKVWAFEPARETREYLHDSMAFNGFDHVTVLPLGLSDFSGEAQLVLRNNSELNHLSLEASPKGDTQTVQISTLDECCKKHAWKNIDFVKLDAEGQEEKIVQAGNSFFSEQSPLVMYELMHGQKVNSSLVGQFGQIGYSSYRLLPGLGVLIPFNANSRHDSSVLNLFCCKEDRATVLERAGFLVRKSGSIENVDGRKAAALVGSLAYMEDLQEGVSNRASGNDNDYMEIANLYATSLSVDKSISDRVSCLLLALKKAYGLLKQGERSYTRLSTFSRIAFDAGERMFGLKILSTMLEYCKKEEARFDEPFFPAAPRYESIDPKANKFDWLEAAALEQWILKDSYSGYFSKKKTLPAFDELERLGYMSDALENRRALIVDNFME